MKSEIRHVTSVEFPEYTGVRVLMMPFWVHAPFTTLPEYLRQYVPLIRTVLSGVRKAVGTGYLTVDEALVFKGEFHRRPGLHVDGIGEDGSSAAAWGGGGGGWGSGGMYLASNVLGCRGWDGLVNGKPGPDGDCSHIPTPPDELAIYMKGGEAYWCNSLALHESLPMREDCHRQFVRISMPNNSPWYESCTPNPLGIKPTGLILPARTAFMAHRP